MNKLLGMSLMLLPLALSAETAPEPAATPAVERVIVRQQWPWSTDVKVEYSLSGVDAANPVDIKVRAFNGTVELPSGNLDAAITGDRYAVTSPVGSLTIDPVAAFGTEQVALGNFKVQLTLTPSDSNMNDIIYKIVDLVSPHAVTDVVRKDLMNGKWGNYTTSFSDIDSTFTTSLDDVLIWLDVTNEVYKTDKIVFRRIPAAGKSFQFQKGIAAATNAYYGAGEGIKVSFTKDYYIGVFELTQRQFRNVTTKFALSYFYQTNALYRWTRPADQVRYSHPYQDRPAATGSTLGAATYALKNAAALKSKAGYTVTLPTEAQWEYACRAGTDTFKYSGASGTLYWNDGFTPKVQRAYNINGSGAVDPGRNCDLTKGSLTVGMLKPNAFGLYDMLGNIYEWCLGYYISADKFWKCACYAEANNFDPQGPTSEEASATNYRPQRGGDYGENPLEYGAMERDTEPYSYNTQCNGVRLCLLVDESVQ